MNTLKSGIESSIFWFSAIATLFGFVLGAVNAINDSYLVMIALAFGSVLCLLATFAICFASELRQDNGWKRQRKYPLSTRVSAVAIACLAIGLTTFFITWNLDRIFAAGEVHVHDEVPVSLFANMNAFYGNSEIATTWAVTISSKTPEPVLKFNFIKSNRFEYVEIVGIECTMKHRSDFTSELAYEYNNYAVRVGRGFSVEPFSCNISLAGLGNGPLVLQEEIDGSAESAIISDSNPVPVVLSLDCGNAEDGIYEIDVRLITRTKGITSTLPVKNGYVVAVLASDDESLNPENEVVPVPYYVPPAAVDDVPLPRRAPPPPSR